MTDFVWRDRSRRQCPGRRIGTRMANGLPTLAQVASSGAGWRPGQGGEKTANVGKCGSNLEEQRLARGMRQIAAFGKNAYRLHLSLFQAANDPSSQWRSLALLRWVRAYLEDPKDATFWTTPAQEHRLLNLLWNWSDGQTADFSIIEN